MQSYQLCIEINVNQNMGIYPHLALQYHAWPSAARSIMMLHVDKFPYPRQQTRGNL